VNPAHGWRRGDGTVLSRIDLTEAVPMMGDELDDIVRLVDLFEEWLRFDESMRDQLDDWLADTSWCPATTKQAWDVIEDLGSVSVQLHSILRAAIPATSHIHPPTP
jgi:hypothetical protein